MVMFHGAIEAMWKIFVEARAQCHSAAHKVRSGTGCRLDPKNLQEILRWVNNKPNFQTNPERIQSLYWTNNSKHSKPKLDNTLALKRII